MNLILWLGVGLLGGAGSLLRFAMDRAVSRYVSAAFPVGTLAINLTGAFLLGLVSASGFNSSATILLGGATLGSYTTFSTWMFESHRLGEDGRTLLMGLNLVGSASLGLVSCALGRYLGAVA